ncbi:hypothetical protein F5882DRAFT_440516 [Hyaloscypha sp. PMI_1271]|nr:hypothetical protein F5882DRAFT_440516 [Hyaloscypha sp. PMI_1271]
MVVARNRKDYDSCDHWDEASAVIEEHFQLSLKFSKIQQLCLLPDFRTSVPLIDGKFEDCGFEGPFMEDYGGRTPISELTFDFNKDSSGLIKQMLNFLISPRADPNNVREITFKGHDWAGSLPLVEHAFSKMHGLKKVHWEIRQPLTDSILHSLEENNPESKLYYNFHGFDKYIKGNISYEYYANYEPLDFVFAALSNASNIRELDLYLHAEGCDRSVGNPWVLPFWTNPSTRFAPLEVLKLQGYELYETCDWGIASAWQKYRAEWDAVELKEYEGDDGDDAEPPAYLKKTRRQWANKSGGPSKATLDRLRGPALPALRHLSINAASGWAATQDEILSFVTNGTTNLLHSLSLQNMGAESGDKLIQTLTSSSNLTQELRYFSYGAGGENIFFLRQSKLSPFLTKSPKLEHLDLNIPRDFNLSPNICGLLNDILSTPTLNHLTLRFPTLDEHFNAPGFSYYEYEEAWSQITNKSSDIYHEVDPLINSDMVAKLFDDMRERKEGAELEELEFYVGEWDRRFDCGMLANHPLRVAYWRCMVGQGCQGEQTRIA